MKFDKYKDRLNLYLASRLQNKGSNSGTSIIPHRGTFLKQFFRRSNMNEEEKRLLEGYGRLSRKNQLLYLAVITGQTEMEEHARSVIREALAKLDPMYADRNPAPMGAALAEEALNG
jgi:hypothetical protein